MNRSSVFIFLLILCFGFNVSSQNKEEINKAYSTAIAEYIKAVYQRDKLRFDTLFIGKHSDLPDIKLPSRIENTPVLVITLDDANKKRVYRKRMVYVNVIGTVTHEHAEFLCVTFFPKYEHQFDCTLKFTYNASKKAMVLDNLAFKNFAYK